MINAYSYTDEEFCRLNVALTPLELELERRLLIAAQELEELREWHEEDQNLKDEIAAALGFGDGYAEQNLVPAILNLQTALEEYEKVSI